MALGGRECNRRMAGHGRGVTAMNAHTSPQEEATKGCGMSVYYCGSCQQPLTGAVAPGEPLRGPKRPMGHEVVSPRMAPGTFKVNFDASLLIFHG